MANPEHLEILKQGVEVWNKWRHEHEDIRPDLNYAVLIGVDLRHADLNYTDLCYADFSGRGLFDLVEVSYANLIHANLTGANFNHTYSFYTNFNGAKLDGADFTNARLGALSFADNDLSEVKGLEAVRHIGPSSIGIDTIYKSQGNIPEVFLRGCGVPEEFITYMRSLTVQPIQFYKSFISYSSKDQKFANRLYTDLQSKGVRCWLDTEALKIGEKIRLGIDEAIKVNEKLLLVLSKHSVASDWVEQEVETALARERKEKRTVLFPIRLDDAVMKVESGWPALIRNTRNIGDFRKWKNIDSYQKVFNRLLRALKAEEKKDNQ